MDVHYLSTGGARTAAVLAADAAFAHVLAERTAVVSRVPPCRPGGFCLRELPPLRAALHDLRGLGLLAALYQVRHEDICRHVGDIRQLLRQTGNTIQPAAAKLATLDDLYSYAATHGITAPAKIKTAC